MDNGLRLSLIVSLSACVLTTSIGCGDGRPRRVRVSGQVLIDGEPLGVGNIRVVPSDARAATGTIGSDGRFTLTTFEKDDGCVPGMHPVVITAFETISAGAIRWMAPPQYRDLDTSELTATIDKETDSLLIELTWNGGKPFIQRMDSTGDAVPESTELPEE
jgi:hypothetical protein